MKYPNIIESEYRRTTLANFLDILFYLFCHSTILSLNNLIDYSIVDRIQLYLYMTIIIINCYEIIKLIIADRDYNYNYKLLRNY